MFLNFNQNILNLIFYLVESSTFYQNNLHNNSQIERKRSRIGSKLCLLEEQLSIEYEDIANKINNNNNEESNELQTENTNEEKTKSQKALSEKPRKQSLFSENVTDKNENLNFYENAEKNVKVNLLIDDKNKILKDEECLCYLNLRIDSNITIFDLIKNAVDAFNDKFKNENFKYLLSNNYNIYKLKASKKNGSQNKDIPGKSKFK